MKKLYVRNIHTINVRKLLVGWSHQDMLVLSGKPFLFLQLFCLLMKNKNKIQMRVTLKNFVIDISSSDAKLLMLLCISKKEIKMINLSYEISAIILY